jgi:PilZ domain
MTERRRHPRIPVDQLMEVRLVGDGVDTIGRVVDLNNAGAFVATELVLEKGTKLEVELRLAGAEKSLPLQAIVARRIEAVEGREHTIPAGLGLVFLTANVMERAFVQMAVLEALKRSLESTRAKVGLPSAMTVKREATSL